MCAGRLRRSTVYYSRYRSNRLRGRDIPADPAINRNQQSVTIESDTGEATMTIRNIPSDENPKTGRITANSVIAALQRLTAPLVSGT